MHLLRSIIHPYLKDPASVLDQASVNMTRKWGTPDPYLHIAGWLNTYIGCDPTLTLKSPLYQRITGGNQRDLARAKNQKKLAEQNKGKRSESNTSIAARKEADAAALRAKQAVSVTNGLRPNVQCPC